MSNTLFQVIETLRPLREAFLNEGFDIRICGGAVRDAYLGIKPHDIDLCTDASPDQQIEIYTKNGFSFFETGLAHGTLTARINHESYEITSLRTETDHDGRHAVVHYITDWLADASRRDFSFNAMSMTFDGTIIDPFGGCDDLKNGIVRFVGNAPDRIKEDALRILRFFRFVGRFGNGSMDTDTSNAIRQGAPGLKNISRERVWMEMAKIISGSDASYLFQSIYDMGIDKYIDLPKGNIHNLNLETKNPVTLMTSLVSCDVDVIKTLAREWKWSANERYLALFLSENNSVILLSEYERLVAYDGRPKEWVIELAKMHGDQAVGIYIRDWVAPIFPVNGDDLIQIGIKQGLQIGQYLKKMKIAWANSSYSMNKETLLKLIQ